MHDGPEIDLVIQIPGKKVKLVEIKSTESLNKSHFSSLLAAKELLPESDCYLVSRDKVSKKTQGIHCLHWEEALSEL